MQVKFFLIVDLPLPLVPTAQFQRDFAEWFAESNEPIAKSIANMYTDADATVAIIPVHSDRHADAVVHDFMADIGRGLPPGMSVEISREAS